MTVPSNERCDLALSNGKRCQNQAAFWIVSTIGFVNPPEEWPMAICEIHRDALKDGKHEIIRLGPDRRKEYAEREQTVTP